MTVSPIPSPRRTTSWLLDSISAVARSSRPWHAASNTGPYAVGWLPVTSVIACPSSTKAAALARSPANRAQEESASRAIGSAARAPASRASSTRRPENRRHVSSSPELVSRVTSEPEPADLLVPGDGLATKRPQCPLQHRCPGLVALGDQGHPAIEEKVGRPRRSNRRALRTASATCKRPTPVASRWASTAAVNASR
jgi:hypothetical protein